MPTDMTKSIAPATRRLLRFHDRLRVVPSLEALRASGSDAAVALADALTTSLTGRADPDEARWFDRIENRRAELLASERRLSDRSERTVGRAALASKPPFWAQQLFHLVRRWRPTHSLELGSCVGVSAAYQAAALDLEGHGRLVTIEGNAGLCEVSADTLSVLGLDRASVVHGRFQEVLDGVLADLQPVDYAFIDGHHDEDATLAYFEQLTPALSPASIVVFDDIAWSDGMAAAWDRVRCQPAVRASVDLGLIGIVVVDPAIEQRIDVRLDVRGVRFRT